MGELTLVTPTELPEQMSVVAILEPGGPEVLTGARRPVPVPGAGEVLIQIAAAGVNRPDCLQRRGLYPAPDGASDLPGLEVSGRVVATAGDVKFPGIGDSVCALLAGGGYADYCVAPAVQCLEIPAGLDAVQAAAIPETFFTVWSNLFDRGGLRDGESVLVHGGASGIGTTAIQLAKTFGATVFATAGGDEKCSLCESIGADRAIDYKKENFKEVVRDATGGKGVDVILDIVGGSYLAGNIGCLATDGRLIIIGVLGGAKAELNLGAVLTRRLTVTGSTLRARSPEFKGRIANALREHVWPRIEAGQVGPVVQATFPLEEAARAHEIIEANAAMGKLVLLPGGQDGK